MVRTMRMALLSALAGLTGCMAQTATMTGYTSPSATVPFEIVDQRPTKERLKRHISLLITSCNYGVLQAGDKSMVPDRMTLLRDELNAALGPQLANKKLIVSHYTAVYNWANVLRGQVYRSNPGLIGEIMKPMGARCKREEMEAGWYEPNDVTTPYSPFIVELTVSVDGKTHEVRVVHSPETEVGPSFGEPLSAAALFTAVSMATKKLIVSLQGT
jgi:hypothetical protein